MAKNKTSKRNADNSEGVPARRVVAPPQNVQVPQGYEKQATDLIGFWDPSKHPTIHFVPLEVKLFDSKLEAVKPSAMVVGKLVGSQPLLAPGGEDEVVQGGDGDLVGIWYKPGMSALKNLAGVKVFMYITGELDTGKPNPMVTYDVLSRTKGGELHVTQDARKKSKHVETAFGGPKGDARSNAANPPSQGDDDVPF